MKNQILLLILCVSNIQSFAEHGINILYPHNTPWLHVPFDIAMERTGRLKEIALTRNIVGIDGTDLYVCFRKLYDQFNLSTIQPNSELKIPKIIHQIWLGSSVPDVYKGLMETWVEQHMGRDWEYKLWTDENVHEITLHNKKFYDATDNYGAKSDILRWELLYQMGGLYVDIDYECLRAFDIFHYTYDFYTGIQPLDTQFLQLGAALVGSRPGHPILKHCIETIKDDWHKKGAPKKTGPVHFTRSFYLMAGKNGNVDIAFPPYYVYPLGSTEKANEEKHRAWKEKGAFANHWWSKSWMPAHYRPQPFRTLGNDTSTKNWND